MHIGTDRTIGLEDNSFLIHDGKALLEPPLLHLEFGNPVAEETTDPVGAFEDRDEMAGAVELLGGRKPGRSGPDHSYFLA